MLKFAKKMGGENGFQNLLNSLSEEDRKHLSGTVLATDRFSESTNQALINGIVNVLFGGDYEKAVEIGKFIIDDGLNFVYRLFFKVGNPSWLVSKGSMLFKQYHEVGSLEVFDVNPNSCRVKLIFPYLDIAFCRVIVGCILRALELSSAKDIILKHEACIQTGSRYCIYYVSWK